MFRRVMAVSFGLMLSACATVPSSAPPSRAFSQVLTVCAGDVDNAPRTDRRGRVADMTPFADIRGVVLARVPTDGCLSSGYGPRIRGASRVHLGVDISTRGPTPVRAAAAGVVVQAEFVGAFGNLVRIEHRRGVETLYGHLSEIRVRRGARIESGRIIGETGRTGNATGVHLHYEIRVDGETVNPLTVTR